MTAGIGTEVRRRHRRRTGRFVVVGCLLAAACGSTAPREATQVRGSELGDDVVADDAIENGETFDDPAFSPDGVDGQSHGAQTRAGAATGAALPSAEAGTRAESPTAAPAPGARGAPAMGPGVTDDTITVGIMTTDLAAIRATFYADPNYEGSEADENADAVVRWMNEHGGIAGRQIEPLYYEFPAEDGLTASARARQEQAMCSAWTEDRRAFASIPIFAIEGVFHECAADNDLVMFYSGACCDAPVDLVRFNEIGHVWYNVAGFMADRREEMFVSQLARRGFLAADAKVAIIIWDNPSTRRAVQRTLEPALEARGVDVVARDFYSDLDHNWSSTVLRFQQAGVTHVMWTTSPLSNVANGPFMSAAEAQRFRPLIAFGLDNGIDGTPDFAPEAQLERTVPITWAFEDWAIGEPQNESHARCLQIARENSLEDPGLLAGYCDALFFLKHHLEAAPSLTVQGFREAVESSASNYTSAVTWSVAFGPNRHDGATAVRDVSYDRACECFRQHGPVHHAE